MTRVRFAPSPTGLLHQGNIRTALFNYLFAKKQGGALILRIDDTDRERSKAEFEQAACSDLKWLGLNWDEGPDRPGNFGPYRQSERSQLYFESLEKLKNQGQVYPCFCTPEEIEAERQAARVKKKAYRYSGKCRELTPEQIQEKQNQSLSFALRFKVGEGRVMFKDLVYGNKSFEVKAFGDFVIARSDGTPLYLFTSAVDDGLMKITHVIRGEDGLSNTPRQILIQQALSLESPKFAHLPLLLATDRSVLSKRHGSLSVGELQSQGYLPKAVLNYLALLGWSHPEGKEILTQEELIQSFDLDRVSRSSAVFDEKRLKKMNQVYLSQGSEEEFLNKAEIFCAPQMEALEEISEDRFKQTLLALRPNIQILSELKDWLEILFGEPNLKSEAAQEVLNFAETKEVLITLKALLVASSENIDEKTFHTIIDSLKSKVAVKGKKLFLPLRIALTGRAAGPELVHLFVILKKEKLLARIDHAISRLQY